METKKGFLTEQDGKPSSTRLNTTAAVWLAFGLIAAQAISAAIGYFTATQGNPQLVSMDILLLLFGYGGFTAAATKFVERKNA